MPRAGRPNASCVATCPGRIVLPAIVSDALFLPPRARSSPAGAGRATHYAPWSSAMAAWVPLRGRPFRVDDPRCVFWPPPDKRLPASERRFTGPTRVVLPIGGRSLQTASDLATLYRLSFSARARPKSVSRPSEAVEVETHDGDARALRCSCGNDPRK